MVEFRYNVIKDILCRYKRVSL